MCPVSWLAAVVRAEVPESVSIALEDRLDHRLAWVDFAVEVRPAKAALPPCTAADFMRHINRRALRLPAVAEELQLKWSSVPSLPPGWPADLCEQAMGSLACRFMLEACPKERGLDLRWHLGLAAEACGSPAGLLRLWPQSPPPRLAVLVPSVACRRYGQRAAPEATP